MIEQDPRLGSGGLEEYFFYWHIGPMLCETSADGEILTIEPGALSAG